MTSTKFFSNPVYKNVQREYKTRVKEIMNNIADCIGTSDDKIEIARAMAKEELYFEAKKTLNKSLNSKWYKDMITDLQDGNA